MEEIEESETFLVSSEVIERTLSPRTIIECEGTYEITETHRTDDRWEIVASTEDLELTLEFVELENGYVYEQIGDSGPFDEMRTSITYEEIERGCTEVTATSRFTFGFPLASITDRVAGWNRQVELRRMLIGLAEEIAE